MLRKRDTVVNGESQVTTTFSDRDIESQASQILEILQLTGPVVLQAMVSADGKLHIIECNTRFGGASTTSIAAGLDSFYWSLLEALGAETAEIPFVRIPGELRQVRMAADECYPVHDSNF